jgi:hypothetical protein
MKKLTLVLALLSLNAFAIGGKTKLTTSDLLIVVNLKKVESLRVYASKKIKTKYRYVSENQTDVGADINTVSKEELLKKVIKRKIKGKIIKIQQSIYTDEVEGVYVSFDKACTKKEQECAYYFARNHTKENFRLVKVPKKLAINDVLKPDFVLNSTNVNTRTVLKVIKKEIDEVKKDTVQSTGW